MSRCSITGSLEQVGAPEELYDHPANEFVLRFIGDAVRLGERLVRPHEVVLRRWPSDDAVEVEIQRSRCSALTPASISQTAAASASRPACGGTNSRVLDLARGPIVWSSAEPFRGLAWAELTRRPARPSGSSASTSTRSTSAPHGPRRQKSTSASTSAGSALEDGLDRAVATVAHPARHSAGTCGSLDGEAKSDTLHKAVDTLRVCAAPHHSSRRRARRAEVSARDREARSGRRGLSRPLLGAPRAPHGRRVPARPRSPHRLAGPLAGGREHGRPRRLCRSTSRGRARADHGRAPARGSPLLLPAPGAPRARGTTIRRRTSSCRSAGGRCRAPSLPRRSSASSTQRPGRLRGTFATARSPSSCTAPGCASARQWGSTGQSVDLENRLVRAFGKGSKERVVPVGREAADALRRYLARGRPHLDRRHRQELFLNAHGGPLTRAGVFFILRRLPTRPASSPSGSIPTSCATRSQRTCSREAPTCARSRRCSDMPIWPRPSSTRTCPIAGDASLISRRTLMRAV